MKKLVEHCEGVLKNKIGNYSSSRFLLAFSGGLDSSVLAFICHKLNLDYAIAHCNFQLRGEESDGDAGFTRELAEKYKRPFFLKSFKTDEYAAEKNISIQMAARELRYKWFDELMRGNDFHYLLSAHHLNDSLETFLINMARGTGIKGLKGITSSEKILRPLAEISRKEINDFAKSNSLNWREDSSNEKSDYQRNYIRHHLIPEYYKAIPALETGLRNSFENIYNDVEFFENQIYLILKELVYKKAEKEYIRINELLALPGFKSVLHHWLIQFGNFDKAAILKSLHQPGGQIFSSGDYCLLVDREELILYADHKTGENSYLIDKSDSKIVFPLLMQFKTFSMSIFELPHSGETAAFDMDKLKFPLKLRRWQKGDRFKPLGMRNFKKLSDYFIDKKFSIIEKKESWLLCSGDDIIWLCGHRIDERFKITNTTKTVYFAELLNEN